ncbi:MAG: hypothetical protein ACI865_001776 [Flavobacteriaceae bacterium]|jgi:hypothetical protein
MTDSNVRAIGISNKQKNRIHLGIPSFLITGICLFIWLPKFMAGVNLSPIVGLILGTIPYFLTIVGFLMLVMFLRARIRWNSQLLLTDSGFTDNAGFGFKGIEIAWKDLEGHKIIKKRNGNYMILFIKNEEQYLSLVSKQAVRNHLEKMKSHNGGYLGLALNWYEVSESDILKIFEEKIALNQGE